jgi:hypothetical protein
MPDCFGLVPDDCESVMGDIGFTGILDQAPGGIDAVDYSQPAGVVISSSPIAGVAVSTAASTVVEATLNPQACETTTDNPHWSVSTESMLSYVHILCTFSGAVGFTATMWQCADDPGLNGINIASADCEVETTTIKSAPVTAGTPAEPADAYVPWVTEGDEPVAWGAGYWIATSVTTEPDPVLNAPQSWSQPDWTAPPP